IIHTRSSTEDAIAIVKENYDLNLKGQFHCFSGDSGQLSSVLEMENFYVSFCGNITYKNYKESEIILNCPENKILSETDSPFLPPVPYRGKRNEPSFITNTISKIAEIKSTDTEILKKNMYLNSKMLFPKMFKKE
ncbi:MAG: TatD family hydrolase, partial [Bacteroidetes bacterium]|nr:TatD family hydrolase [Bacteroidota bacterium]